MSENYIEPSRLGTVYDYILVVLIGVACIPYLIGIIVIFLNRDYRPIMVQSVTLTVMSALGGLIWVVATITANNHFGRAKDTVWTICSLWTFWLQFCFGFALWLNCMTIHLVQLYYLLILKKGIKKQHTFIWTITFLLVLLSPVIITCIFASIHHASRFEATGSPRANEHHPKGDCKIRDKRFVAILLAFLPAYFLLFLGFAFKLRKFMAQYNSFREIRNGGVMSLFVFLLSLVTLQTYTYRQIVGRCFLSLSVALVVFYYFWVRNGEVIYNVLFHKKAYGDRFNADINQSLFESRFNRNSPPEGKMMMQELLYKIGEDRIVTFREVKELEADLEKLKQTCEELTKQLHGSKPLALESLARLE